MSGKIWRDKNFILFSWNLIQRGALDRWIRIWSQKRKIRNDQYNVATPNFENCQELTDFYETFYEGVFFLSQNSEILNASLKFFYSEFIYRDPKKKPLVQTFIGIYQFSTVLKWWVATLDQIIWILSRNAVAIRYQAPIIFTPNSCSAVKKTT